MLQQVINALASTTPADCCYSTYSKIIMHHKVCTLQPLPQANLELLSCACSADKANRSVALLQLKQTLAHWSAKLHWDMIPP